jgi:NADH-quinone oxidoreductase subunit E
MSTSSPPQQPDFFLAQRRKAAREMPLPADDEDLALLEAVLDEYPRAESSLIPLLQRAQTLYNYLPQSAMARIAQHLRLPWSRVYGVATFYAQFYFEPRGKHVVRVCRGTACHVRGGKRILGTVQNNLGIEDGETTPDLLFSLETVACLGACALAPVMVVDNVYYGRLTPDKASFVLESYREAASREETVAES